MHTHMLHRICYYGDTDAVTNKITRASNFGLSIKSNSPKMLLIFCEHMHSIQPIRMIISF